MKRWAVVLVEREDSCDEPGRVFGSVAEYRLRWFAERRRRIEEAADVRLRQCAHAEWKVWPA